MTKRAFVTTLSGGDAYVPGLEALGRSLSASGTAVPRVALITRRCAQRARDGRSVPFVIRRMTQS